MKDSHYLVEATARRLLVDLWIISEPNINHTRTNTWYTDDDMVVTLTMDKCQIKELGRGRGKGFVWVEIRNSMYRQLLYIP